jgi:hypothetical protein
VHAQVVVAAVSQAAEGVLSDAVRANSSYEGLYDSNDSGATWSLARITDGNGFDVQGPTDTFTLPDGNAATSVVWNPVRSLFVAAVRYHGYYQSSDGVTWTRLSAQPGAGLTTGVCPTNPGSRSAGCKHGLYCDRLRGVLDTADWQLRERHRELLVNCTTQLAANSSCSIGVIFDPSAAGVQTGILTIFDLTRAQPQTVALSGTGILPPQISVNPISLSFPAQAVGVASAPVGLTISNTGGAPMANVGFQISGQSAASFSTGVTTCTAQLNNGSSCSVQVIFNPTMAGGAAAILAVSSSTLGVKAVQAALTGTGQDVGINVSPTQMTFTVGTIGQPSAVQTATITNSSTLAANGLALAVNAPFSLAQNTCGTSLAAAASCSVGVIYTPTANGASAGALTIASSLNAATIILGGIGGAAGSVQLQPALLTFSTTGVGSGSAAQIVTVTNAGPVALANLAMNVSSGFQLASTSCTPLLAVGATCTAGVTFNPATAGQQTGNLTLTSSAMAASERRVSLGWVSILQRRSRAHPARLYRVGKLRVSRLY